MKADPSERVTVSGPRGIKAQLAAAAAAAGAPSVSAYVVEAVQERIARDEALARWDAAFGPPDTAALEWARELIGRLPVESQTAAP